jgi:hypothetical protein
MAMNLESEILREHSRVQALRLARWVGSNRQRFRTLMSCFLRGDYRTTQRSAWIVGICAEQHPELVRPYLGKILARMQEPGVHDAVKRNVIRILQTVDIPRGLLGIVADICFRYLAAVDTPIAVKAFSMTVLARIAEREPDLKRELRIVIEQQLPYASPGIRARARRILKMIAFTPPLFPGEGAGG